ncbi:MAG: sulfotransferase domain-containing protein [Steroidobacteraceae bacterium]
MAGRTMRNPMKQAVRRLRYGQPVIVVSGLPRSGTSMLMKMLHAGGIAIHTDHERRADEDNPEGYFEFERVKELANATDKSWVRQARGKALKVISHLLKELPDDNFYLIILARRDLQEVVASQNIMLTRRGQPNPVADAEAEALYRKHLIHVTMHTNERPNMELLTVHYRELLTEPRRSAEQISRFIGARLDLQAMATVVDPRLYRNRAASI